MSSGYYAACTGLRAQTQALELIASNMANLSTAGYRGQLPVFRSLLTSSMPDPLNHAINDFGVLGGSRTDLNAGTMERTENPLDLAIEGKGFFAVQTPAGTLYTRNGNFQISSNGQLVTAAGDPVLGEQGPVTIPDGTVTISADGTISAKGAISGKLRDVEFASSSSLVAVGNSYYAAPQGSARPSVDSSIRQNMLESSNVDPMKAVVDLITLQRHAEMLERAMSAFHNNLDHTAAADLPKV